VLRTCGVKINICYILSPEFSSHDCMIYTGVDQNGESSGMPKPKIRVLTKQAVDLIRSGASDALLMETFGLSDVGLRKLFKKLVDAGEIEQAELDRRALSSQSQTVSTSAILEEVLYEIDGNGNRPGNELKLRKPIVDSKDGDRPPGAANRPKKLVTASEEAQFRIDDHEEAFRGPERGPRGAVTRDYSLPEDDPWHRNNRRWTFSGFVRKHKITIAALLGGIAGMAILAAAFFVFGGFGRVPALPKSPAKIAIPSEEARSDGDKQVQEALTILEAIARDRNDPAKSERIAAGATYLEDCLNNCKKAYVGADDSERFELTSCQRECLHTHSELFRKIRQKYHGETQ
jgi:hypothetical protein